MIDTHTHLTDSKFKEDFEEVISRAKAEKIELVFCQSTSIENAKEVLTLSSKYPEYIYPCLGLHPEDIAEMFLKDPKIPVKDFADLYMGNVSKLLEQNLGSLGFKAIGEIGLDYFMFKIDQEISKLSDPEKLKLIELQKYYFEKLVLLAVQNNLPVVIHSREYPYVDEIFTFNKCINDILEILDRVEKGSGKKVNAVFHCWTYTNKDVLIGILEKGYYVSFTNIICYPKNTILLELAKFVNENYSKQIMLETDSPYLPPANRRGERCVPSDVKYVYDMFPTSRDQIDSNANIFFNIV
ncbi:MAG: TatD family hydrolase [bacterium]